ncbi:glycoside hydrolase family 15 protein [Tunturiibacter gelidoferens]|uniref:GH15 family glucan-1,4-alpha-glucosidase n=1 Tax=Tunturiibacter gelidiferens TaxID=3069689 RepID=A0A9X0QJ32_9BACT|nr:glycoside hydrolase family 15 protein [Edaphobacter lichenicola]MBB5331189.1 GH15 family glucan-1,4-alpha-glucosidase [Edaphobacter lichenicola]
MAEPKKKETGPLHGSRIEDYCMIGDCETAALVSKEGSIDWLCWPTFSSAACFAALLGTRDHGFWQIAPKGKVKAIRRQYVGHTLIVETTFETREGEVCLTDFMPPREKHSHVVRTVRGIRGRVAMQMDLAIRFDYGRTTPWVTSTDDGIRAIAGMDMITLRTKAKLRGEGMTTRSDFTVRKGQTMTFTLTGSSSLEKAPPELSVDKAYAEAERFWTKWSKRNAYIGPYEEAVERSLITLKAMTYKPSGGIVAAVTTSLPEKIGGPRNWDYRYCWLRDTAFTLLILMQANYMDEAVEWRKWLLRAIAGAPDQVQTIYGICGERQLVEWEADWLPGYEGSSPVRIGNAAVDQFQLDVFGEVSSALSRIPQAEDEIRVSATSMQASLTDHLCKMWENPDEGIWETRGGAMHFTHSKVMAWVALDRAIRHHEQFDGKGDVKRWRKNREMLHREICKKGFDKKLNSFVQSYGSKQLDASCLRIGLVGFLPMDDPRIIGTVEAIEKRLMKNGFVERYDTKKTDDGLAGSEGAFLACSFWLVTNLWLIGRKEDAKAMFERLLALRNDVGLLSEEYDPIGKRMVGNFPQALSHIALIHSAFAMSGLWTPIGNAKAEAGKRRKT